MLAPSFFASMRHVTQLASMQCLSDRGPRLALCKMFPVYYGADCYCRALAVFAQL